MMLDADAVAAAVAVAALYDMASPFVGVWTKLFAVDARRNTPHSQQKSKHLRATTATNNAETCTNQHPRLSACPKWLLARPVPSASKR